MLLAPAPPLPSPGSPHCQPPSGASSNPSTSPHSPSLPPTSAPSSFPLPPAARCAICSLAKRRPPRRIRLGATAQDRRTVRDSLPPDQQANLGIVVGNYGENGAIELFGPAYHLPPPYQRHQFRVAALAIPHPAHHPHRPGLETETGRLIRSMPIAADIPYPRSQNNEESRTIVDIYLCGPPRLPWPEFWKVALSFLIDPNEHRPVTQDKLSCHPERSEGSAFL